MREYWTSDALGGRLVLHFSCDVYLNRAILTKKGTYRAVIADPHFQIFNGWNIAQGIANTDV